MALYEDVIKTQTEHFNGLKRTVQVLHSAVYTAVDLNQLSMTIFESPLHSQFLPVEIF